MKKIIKGKTYNTATAKKVAIYQNFRWVDINDRYEENLYLKRTGEYFLYGIGGPYSKYSIHCKDGTIYGNDVIIPLSKEEAKKWSQEYLSTEKYEELFGTEKMEV